MTNLEKAIDRIKILECPTGKLEERLVSILEDYKVAKRDEILIKRDREADKGDLKAYRVGFKGDKENSLLVFAKAGMDDYVIKVFEVIY